MFLDFNVSLFVALVDVFCVMTLFKSHLMLVDMREIAVVLKVASLDILTFHLAFLILYRTNGTNFSNLIKSAYSSDCVIESIFERKMHIG